MDTAQPVTAEAGTHLIADFRGVETIDSVEALERVVRAAVEVAGATLLELSFHKFPGHGGITGYAMLAESHISVHTWPERDYVAIDVFMCGEQRPADSLEVLRRAFRPSSEEVRVVRRGAFAEVTNESNVADGVRADERLDGAGEGGDAGDVRMTDMPAQNAVTDGANDTEIAPTTRAASV